jgi:3-deoxy-D-manno-octulosonic-acid transferase
MSALGLSVYRIMTQGLAPLAPLWLKRRVNAGKEDAARLGERLGRASLARPPAKLIWLHGASVGEAEMAITLIQALGAARADLQFLLTTGTRTSAELAAARLGKNARHQYLPLDIPGAVHSFLQHWQPDLGVFMESEIWPNLILAAKAQGVKLALVNGRLNDASFRRWQNLPASAAHLLDSFDWIGVADPFTLRSIQHFTKRDLKLCGSLKHAAMAPNVTKKILAGVRANLGKDAIWLALSTHKGEEEMLLAAHRKILEQVPKARLVLVPRHPERGVDIARLCQQVGLGAGLHSKAEPANENTRVYIGDSIGEMGLWLRLGSPAFIGGSLMPALRGHTPVEAAKLGVPVFTGPYRASFAEIYQDLLDANGVLITPGGDAIAKAVLNVWDNPKQATDMAKAAQTLINDRAQAPLQTTIKALLALVEESN